MRQKLLASAAIILGAACATPAAAEITVLGTIVYDKAVVETETLTKVKVVAIDVVINRAGDTASESNAITNQRVGVLDHEGFVTSSYESGGFAAIRGFDYWARMDASVVDNEGITQVNQDVGNSTNQGNVLSAAVGSHAFFAEANNAAAQHIDGAIVRERGRGNPEGVIPAVRLATMTNSVNDNTGVTQVNQNAGVFNNQLNQVALGLGFNNGSVALAESALGQWNTHNQTYEFNNSRSAQIANTGNNNTGVTMGNQAAGYMANQANMVSVSAAVAAPAAAAGLSSVGNAITPRF